VHLVDLTGVITFTNDTVTGSANSNVEITTNPSASASVEITTLTVTGGSFSNATGDDGFLIDLQGSSKLDSALFSGVTFSGNFAKGLQIQQNNNSVAGNGVGTSPAGTITVSNSTFTNNNVGASFEGGGGTGGTGSVYYRFLNNTVTGSHSHAVNF